MHDFDSLVTAGYSRTNAVGYLYPNNNFDTESVSMTDSTYSFYIQPNGVTLLEFSMLEVTVSVEEKSFISQLFIYPNPTTDFVQIDIHDKDLKLIYIYDINGRLIETFETTGFSMKKYPNGLYFLVIGTENETTTKRLIKN